MADEADIEARLTAVCAMVFSDPAIILNREMTAADIPGWNSLSHINLIVAVEKAFGISLTARDARSMKNVGDFIALIARKLPA
jgi:acyl carrier protein